MIAPIFFHNFQPMYNDAIMLVHSKLNSRFQVMNHLLLRTQQATISKHTILTKDLKGVATNCDLSKFSNYDYLVERPFGARVAFG